MNSGVSRVDVGRTDLTATSGQPVLYGTNNNERLIGTSEPNMLVGNGGRDEYYPGRGMDRVSGGNGDDTYYYAPGDDVDVITDRGGTADQLVIRGRASWHDLVLSEFSGGLEIRVGPEENGDMILITEWGWRDNYIECLVIGGEPFSVPQIEQRIVGNRRPKVTRPLDDQIAVAGQPFRFTIPDGTFVDAEGDTLNLVEYIPGGEWLPKWLTFDPDRGVFFGTPQSEDVGEIPMEIRANDSGNRIAIATMTIRVVAAKES